jgi:hypothetical protein
MLRVNTRVETQGDRTGGEERLNRRGVFVVTESSTGPIKQFREMTVAHGGGHCLGMWALCDFVTLCSW